MKLAVVAAVGSYTPEDLEHKKRSLRTVLRPDTHLDMFVAASGVPYVESSLELYLSEVAVARKVVEIPVVGPAKTTMYMAATLAHKFGVITAAGDLPRHIWALAKLLGVADRVVGIPTLKCTVADFLHDEDNALAMIITTGRHLMEDQGAEALVLGCGAPTGLAPRIAQALGIPVLDPGLTAVKY